MEPATIAAIGAAAQGAGSLLSGFGIGKKDAPDPATMLHLQSAYTLKHEKDAFNQKMQLAQEHGIHPLAILGAPMSTYSPTIQVGSDHGTDFRDIGYGVNQLANAFVQPPEAAKPEAKMPAPEDPVLYRQRLANMRRMEAEASLSELALSNAILRGAGAPPGVRTSNDATATEQAVAAQSGIPLSMLTGSGGKRDAVVKIEQSVAPPHPSLPGFAAGADQGWGRIADRNGSLVPLVRQDAVQADIEKGATFQALANAFGIERAMQITAILENEHLLLGAAVGGGLLMRTPAARLAKWLWGKKDVVRSTFAKRGPRRTVDNLKGD